MPTASSAPIGSFTMPSHFRILRTRDGTRSVRSMGPITVGPVTIMIPPSSAEISQDRPAP